MELEICDYREILRVELETRCSKNSKYSLRAFARDLGFSPARLSDVLRGRYGLSREAAVHVSKKLGFSDLESSRFIDLVESRHARNHAIKNAARERVKNASFSYRSLTIDTFKVISDWYHYAILELCLTEKFQSDSVWIAEQLGISRHVALAAVERLKRLDLLELKDNGRLKPTTGFTASPDGVPSDAIKRFHKQILEKAIQAVDFQSIEERDFSNIILAVDEMRLPEAKEAIKKFRRKFDQEFGNSRNKNRVYNLSIQFFRKRFISPMIDFQV